MRHKTKNDIDTCYYNARRSPSVNAHSDPWARLDLLRIEIDGAIAHLRLNRPSKRNALNDTLIAQIDTDVARTRQVLGWDEQ